VVGHSFDEAGQGFGHGRRHLELAIPLAFYSQ
jgi:hypothetical protein